MAVDPQDAANAPHAKDMVMAMRHGGRCCHPRGHGAYLGLDKAGKWKTTQLRQDLPS